MPRTIAIGAIPGICNRIEGLRGGHDGLAEILLQVRDLLDASCICFGGVEAGGDRILSWVSPEADPEIREFYTRDGYPWGQNPWAKIINGIDLGEMMRTELAGPRQALKRTEFYDVFIRRFDILETLGFRLYEGQKESFFLGVFRGERRGRFDATAERAAAMLFDPFRRFARLSASADGLHRGPASEAVLVHELRRRGVVLTPQQGQVLWLSYAGDRDKEIADKLGLRLDKVKRILGEVRVRLGVERTKDAVRVVSGITVEGLGVDHGQGT